VYLHLGSLRIELSVFVAAGPFKVTRDDSQGRVTDILLWMVTGTLAPRPGELGLWRVRPL
jgi:hypothetical protein